MSNMLKAVSDEEISKVTKLGKGVTPLVCAYNWALCFVGYPKNGPSDSGTCTYLMQQCGWTSYGDGSSGLTSSCGTCTCR